MVDRFQVMALLQAARATALGYTREEAESFGLNRAIFYAAAKRGFYRKDRSQHHSAEAHVKGVPAQEGTPAIKAATIGNETAYYIEHDGKKRYVIGEAVQEPEDFRRQIAQRFGDAFPIAWEQAMQIVGNVKRATLQSQQRFYAEVYQPRRDKLAAEWTALSQHR